MNTRFRLGISVFAALAMGAFSQADAAVTVMGGGMAHECYLAVEKGRMPPMKALEMCDQALEQEHLNTRDHAATLINRGIIFMRQGNFQRALWDYEEGLKLKPDLIEAKVDQGAALFGLKRYDEALAALNEGVKTDSVEARAIGLYNRALVEEHFDDERAAYFDYQAALELKPDFSQAAKQLERFTVTEVGN